MWTQVAHMWVCGRRCQGEPSKCGTIGHEYDHSYGELFINTNVYKTAINQSDYSSWISFQKVISLRKSQLFCVAISRASAIPCLSSGVATSCFSAFSNHSLATSLSPLLMAHFAKNILFFHPKSWRQIFRF